MRRIVSDKPKESVVVVEQTNVSTGIDLKELLDKCRLILQREIRNISSESMDGRLSRDASMSLVNYIKVLKELIQEENELFDNLSDEELEKLLKTKQ